MVRTASTMSLSLQTELPEFSLPDPDGRVVSTRDFRDRDGLLVMFISNHCPFVQHIRSGLAAFGKDYQSRGLGIVAINSNDSGTYPDDSPEKMKEEAEKFGYTFPYLIDATQEVAKRYRAACTPDLFLFDRSRRLVYRGQFDSSRPGNDVPVTGSDIRAASDAVLAGRPVPEEQTPSVGCNIKWIEGNAPEYFGG